MIEQTPESKFDYVEALGYDYEENARLSQYPQERFLWRLLDHYDDLSSFQRNFSSQQCDILAARYGPLRGRMAIYELLQVTNILMVSAERDCAINSDSTPQMQGKSLKDASRLVAIHAAIDDLVISLSKAPSHRRKADVKKWLW